MAHQYPTLPRNGFLLPERIKARYDGVAEGKRSASWDALDIGINSLNTPVLRGLARSARAFTVGGTQRPRMAATSSTKSSAT